MPFLAQSIEVFRWDEHYSLGVFLMVAGLVVLGLVLNLVGAIRLGGQREGVPYRVLNVGLLLRHSERLATFLALQISMANMESPERRQTALELVARSVQRDDVLDGFYDIEAPVWSARKAKRRAQNLVARQKEIAGEALQRLLTSAEGEPVLVAQLVASLPNLVEPPQSPNLNDDLLSVLRAAAAAGQTKDSTLKVTCTPAQGRTLTRGEGQSVFDALLASTM